MNVEIHSLDDYFSKPLSQNEINHLRLMQNKWCDYEKKLSLAALSLLTFFQFGIMLIDDSWTMLLTCFAINFVAYCSFKSMIPRWLDKRFPCRVIVGDETVSLPYTKDLTDVAHYPKNLEAHPLLQNIAKQKRSLVKFEFEILKSQF